ncbi:MAG: DUF4405 domain-containing protein [Phycisphaerae bacterium]|nr:DUF4405 domain-containing protein [Phycisphaerae bacterium]
MTERPPATKQPRHPARMQMVNFVIDVVTLLVVLAMAATGLLLKFVLPPGNRGGQGVQLWGFTRHEWGDVHFWLSVAMGVLFIVHVALHWTWVCAIVARWFPVAGASPGQASARRRSAYGAGFLVAVTALLFGFAWVAGASATRPTKQSEQGGRGYRGGRNASAVRDVGGTSPAVRERGHRGVAVEP